MSQPYSLNRNPLAQRILTPDGRVEELPIGSLRVPPPVGFQSVAECGGALGICFGVAAEACYIVEGGLAIVCGIVSSPVVCIAVGVGIAGYAVYTICTYDSKAGEVKHLEKLIMDHMDELIRNCGEKFAEGSDELSNCITEVVNTILKMLKDLRDRYNIKGPGTTDPNGTTGRQASRQM